jgi:flavin reductase (DIM6/NTAB) family NADH-FMN oxidoreductase RutF
MQLYGLNLKLAKKINLGTHTFFIGEIIDCKTLNPDERVAYMGDTRMKYGGVPRGGH